MNFNTIDSTVGGTNSNSYGTLQELKDYFLNRSEATEFLALSDAEIIARMIQATLVNDTVLHPYGEIATDTQNLLFPRTDLYDKHGRAYDDDVIPDKIKYAQFEQALYLHTNNIRLPSILTQGFSEAKLDVMSVKLDKDFIPSKLSPDAKDYLALFGQLIAGENCHSIGIMRY